MLPKVHTKVCEDDRCSFSYDCEHCQTNSRHEIKGVAPKHSLILHTGLLSAKYHHRKSRPVVKRKIGTCQVPSAKRTAGKALTLICSNPDKHTRAAPSLPSDLEPEPVSRWVLNKHRICLLHGPSLGRWRLLLQHCPPQGIEGQGPNSDSVALKNNAQQDILTWYYNRFAWSGTCWDYDVFALSKRSNGSSLMRIHVVMFRDVRQGMLNSVRYRRVKSS